MDVIAQWIPAVASLAIATAAVFTDSKRGIIPNRLTFPAMFLGLAVSAGLNGVGGLGLAAQGMAVALGLMLIPFVVGGMGAGDVKLLIALGAWLGPGPVVWTFTYGALLGGVLALLLIVRQQGWAPVYLALSGSWRRLLSGAGDGVRTASFPYAAALWFGVIATNFVGRAA